MRIFIILSILAVASADSLGYNYQPVGHSDEGLSFQPGASSGEALLSQPIQGPAFGQGSFAPAPAAEEFQKEFYSFSAPENEFNDGGQQGYNPSVKKNLRVIFIKGPENNGIENAAAQLAQQAGEDKTAIYVLQKQADAGGLVNQLQNIRAQSQSRPEVHFVKYRTQQDAQNAEQTIRSQYDQLPGSSRSSNEGSAPVLNFASQAPVSQGAGPAAVAGPSSQYLPANPVPQQSYLPPSLRRYLRF